MLQEEELPCCATGRISTHSIQTLAHISHIAQIEHLGILTGRSEAGSATGALRVLACSGLGVVVPPCNEFIELFTLPEGVVVRCTAPLFSFGRPPAFWSDNWELATELGPSFAAWAFSAFFLLLKRNAIVPCEAYYFLCESDLPTILLSSFSSRNLRWASGVKKKGW